MVEKFLQNVSRLTEVDDVEVENARKVNFANPDLYSYYEYEFSSYESPSLIDNTKNTKVMIAKMGEMILITRIEFSITSAFRPASFSA